jgi:hypothetical protein
MVNKLDGPFALGAESPLVEWMILQSLPAEELWRASKGMTY